jgi:hypothetical protein
MRAGRAKVGAWRARRELAFLDRRREEARFMAELRQELIADYGGNPSAAKVLLIECACFAALRIARLTTPWLAQGEDLGPTQLMELIQWQGELRATLKTLGIERFEAAPVALAELLASPARKAAAPSCRRRSAQTRPWALGPTAAPISNSSAGGCRHTSTAACT